MVAFLLGIMISLGQLFIDLKGERERLDDTIQQVLSISRESAVQAAINLDKGLAEQVAKGLFQFPPIYRAEIADNFGGTLAVMERNPPAGSYFWEWLADLVLEPSKSYSVELIHPDYHEKMGMMTVEVDIHSFTRTFFSRATMVIFSGLLRNFLLAFILFILFHYVLTRPLLSIISAFAGITPGGTNNTAITVSPIHRDDELGVLVHTINDLLGKFNAVFEKLTRAEVSLRSSEEQVRLLLNSTAEAIYGLDLDGNCTFVNNSCLRLLGYQEADELIGKHMHALSHHSQFDGSPLPVEDCRIHKAFLEGKGVHVDNEVLWRADGTSFPAEYWSYPIVRDGKTIGAVVTFLDISLRKQAENALAAEKEHLVVTLRSIGDGVITTDKTGNVILLNKAAEQLTGWTSGEAEGRPLSDVFDIINERTGEPCESPVEKILRTGKIVNLSNHTALLAKDGTKRSIADSGAPILDREHRIIGVVLVFRDISEQVASEKERLALESQLQQAQKMESIGTLAGGIAHDFNNILSAIYGYTELAQQDIDAPETLRQDLDEILQGAARAQKLVQQILTFSKKTEQKKKPQQISLVVKEALKLLRSSIPATIEIQQNIVSESLVLADPTQIHQIVMNLCTNAYHAMRETGGTLFVTLKEIEMAEIGIIPERELPPGRYLQLEISDNGTGMDEETRAKIFEPYFTTKEPGEGTGLGLAVVHGVVESHGGCINVYSEPGQGTTFHICLPVYEGEGGEITANKQEVLCLGGNETVMLVDDERAILDIAKKFFKRHGYKVYVFTNGVPALQEFQQQPEKYDLVITDMTMPYMTGAQLSQKLLETRPDIPIILCTGHSEQINREKSLAMGIKEYLEKPLNLDNLLQTAREVLDG